jgi:hypothetical protein
MHESRERCVDLTVGVGVEDADLNSHGTSRRFHISHRGLGDPDVLRLNEQGNARGRGHHLAQELEPLCRHLGIKKIDPGRVAARPGEAGDKTKPDRVIADAKDDRSRRRCSFGRQRTT